MGFSIFAMVACIVKTVELKTLGSRTDFTYNVSSFIIWLSVENYVVIIAASIPTLRPLAMRIWKMHLDRKSHRHTEHRSSLPPYQPEWSWKSRPNAVRLQSVRSGSEKWDLEPPYIHPKPRNPPPSNTIRKTISIYVRSASECDEVELRKFDVGVRTQVSARGRSTETTAQNHGWRTTRNAGRARPASTEEADMADLNVDVDIERQ